MIIINNNIFRIVSTSKMIQIRVAVYKILNKIFYTKISSRPTDSGMQLLIGYYIYESRLGYSCAVTPRPLNSRFNFSTYIASASKLNVLYHSSSEITIAQKKFKILR